MSEVVTVADTPLPTVEEHIPLAQVDFEPDAQWQASTRKQIEQGLRHLVEKARTDRDEKLKDFSADPILRTEIAQEYTRTMDNIRQLADEQYRELRAREIQERRWAAGHDLDHKSMELFIREQEALLIAIQKRQRSDSNATDANHNRRESADIENGRAGKDNVSRLSLEHYRDLRPQYGDSRGLPVSDRSSVVAREEQTHASNGDVANGSRPWSGISAQLTAVEEHQTPSRANTIEAERAGVSRKPSTASLSATQATPEFWRPSISVEERPGMSRTLAHATANSEASQGFNRPDGLADPTRGVSRTGSMRSESRSSHQGGRADVYAVDDPWERVGRNAERQRETQQNPFTGSRSALAWPQQPQTPDAYQFRSSSSEEYFPPVDKRASIPIRSSSRNTSAYQGSPEHTRYQPSSLSGARPVKQQRSFTSDNEPRPDPSSPSFRGPQTIAKARPIINKRASTVDDSDYQSQSSPTSRRWQGPEVGQTQIRRNSAGSRSVRSQASGYGTRRPALYPYSEDAMQDSDEYESDWEEGGYGLIAFEEREDEVRRIEEVKRMAAEAKIRAEEVRRKEEEVMRKEEEVRRKDAELKAKEVELQRARFEAWKREEEIKRREADVQRQAEEARQKSQEARRQAEETEQRKEESKRLEEENRRKEQELAEQREELHRREIELDVEEARLKTRAEKLRRREELSKQEEEARARAQEELQRQEAQLREEARRREELRQREELQQQELRRQEQRAQEEERKLNQLRKEEELRQLQERRQEEARREEESQRREQSRREAESRKQEQLRSDSRTQESRRSEQRRRAAAEDARLQAEPELQRPSELTGEESDLLSDPDFIREQEALLRGFEKRKRQDSLPSAETLSADVPPSASTSSTPWTIPGRSDSTSSSASGDRSSTTSSSFGSSSGFSFSGRSTGSTYTQASTGTTSSTPTATARAAPAGWKASQGPPTPASASAKKSAAPPTTSGFTPEEEEEWKQRQREHARRQQEQFQRLQEQAEQERQSKHTKQLTKEDVIKVFEDHERRWSKLATTDVLGWYSFPWPMLRTPQSPEDLTVPAIDAYVLSPHSPSDKAKSPKDRIKEHIKRWHPDRFETKLLPKVRPDDQEKVKEGAGVVARNLNELLTRQSTKNNLFA